MKAIGHKMILASAGSGKTYALTNRFVQLLAGGAAPERIVALTFTRKAAGEFFDEILNKLARAARDPREAARIAAEIGEPALGEADFLRMLRAMTTAMHRLALGTLDSFFARVVRTFPLELGLGGDFEILQEHGARLERQRVLRRLFERGGGDLDEAQKEFIEAFKRATFGAEEKRLAARLDRFLDEHQQVFLDAPDGEAWGNPARIWPDGAEWLKPAGDTKAAAETVRSWVAGAGLGEKQRQRWDDFLRTWEEWAPGATPPRELVYVLEKALESWAELAAGVAELEFDRKKQTLSREACFALKALVAQVFAGELTRRLEMTRGIHMVLRGYEAIYGDAVRRAGKLTFADVQRLLMPETGAPRLSSGGSGEGRLLVDWRLDAKYDHWLLDEFQDTSHAQWSVLSNLIDEAVQDPEGRRSFFYVGDVKQAIYAWRGGDPRLFREIFDRYNQALPGVIEEGRLDQSWRSGPVIVSAVNKVFGDAAALARLVPGPAAERWTGEWRDHESARPALGGQVAWLHGDDEEARAAATLRLLAEIEPLERGLSVAVLVQSNDAAAWLADYLRREGGLAAVAESDLHVCSDNPLTTAVLALLQAAAHPGDTLAWEHALMTPLAALLAEDGGPDRERATRAVLMQIHEEGFARTVEAWSRRLEAVLDEDDVFSRGRAAQLSEAAQEFDATGSRDVAEFVQFAGRHAVRDAETATVVRVMTIHKSKGLGFDVVVLPDLEGTALATPRRDGLAVARDENRAARWVLDLPPKLFCENDAALAGYMAAASADAAYEKLCLYYVAMTRAKRALYLVTKTPSGKSKSDNFTRLLAETLGASGPAGAMRVGGWNCDGSFVAGDSEWFASCGRVVRVDEKTPDGGRVDCLTDVEVTRRHAARTPSGEKSGVVAGGSLFGASGMGAASFGTAVHRALAAVEWGGATPDLLAVWESAGLGESVIAEARACIEAPELAVVFARKAGATVWRERMFEIVIDGAWITGVFDRVVIEKTEAGNIGQATVYDFKTDKADESDEAEIVRRYQGQMAVYRTAAARLAGISEEQVRCMLVLTWSRKLIGVRGDPAN